MFFGDGGIFLTLGFVACRRQPAKIWRSIVTAAVQEHCAAQNNRWALRTGCPSTFSRGGKIGGRLRAFSGYRGASISRGPPDVSHDRLGHPNLDPVGQGTSHG